MERHTFNPQLPRLLHLTAMYSDNIEDRYDMELRDIIMHTPTGGIVEILSDYNYIIKGNYQQLPFSEFTEDKSMRNMALLLHNKPGSISIEDGRKAMEAVSKWYIKHTLEYRHINNLKWIDCQ